MVKIHFGTDGIRGRANENLTITMAYRIGQYLVVPFLRTDTGHPVTL